MEEDRKKRILEVLNSRQPEITILLENVFDPHNISATMRTCDSVGIGTIHTLYTEAAPHNHTGFRSSAGAWKWIERVEHQNRKDCIAALKATYGRVYAAHPDAGATPLFDFDFTQPVAIVFGNEQKGCTSEILDMCDGSISIPQIGMVQSLNISVACAIILYEAFRQKFAAGHYDKPALPDEDIKKIMDKWTDYKIVREKKQRKP